MLLTEFLDITINTKIDRTYYKLGYYNRNYCCEFETIKIKITDLMTSSRIYVKVKCDVCGKEKEIQYYKYLDNIKKYPVYCCSQKCASFKIKLTKKENYGDENYNNRNKCEITCLERYDVKNVMQNKDIKKSAEDTLEKRIGVRSPMKDDTIKNKQQQTMLDYYGKKHPPQLDEFKEKSKQTKEDRYGDKNYNNRQKAENTCLEKFNVKNCQQNNEIREKTLNTCLKNNGYKYPFL